MVLVGRPVLRSDKIIVILIPRLNRGPILGRFSTFLLSCMISMEQIWLVNVTEKLS